MKNFIKQITYVSLLAVLILPLASYAQSGSVLRDNLNVQSDTLIDVTSTTTVDNSMNTGKVINIQSGSQVGLDARSVRQENAENNTGTNLTVNASGVAVIASSQVQSENDLLVFNLNMSAKSNAVAEVNMNSNDEEDTKIEVVYNQKGKFLGLFSMDVKIKAIVEAKANGQSEIRTKKPWFGFLITHESFDKSEIESKIRENVIVKANTKANMSAQARAEIAEAVIAELDAYTQTQASLAK